MSGDWIKMRVNLRDDPAVIAIADALGMDEFGVVGRLHAIWSWADQQLVDGFAPAVTAKWLDRYVAKTGFSAAMSAIGWLVLEDRGAHFPGFEKHNGKPAKVRAEAALRQRMSRETRANLVTGVARTVIPSAIAREVMHRDSFTCVYCGRSSDEQTETKTRFAVLSIDHLLPAARGGKNSQDNLVTACIECNQEKSDRTPEEWGMVPKFLSASVTYAACRVTSMSQETCDTSVTREEKRRVLKTAHDPKPVDNSPAEASNTEANTENRELHSLKGNGQPAPKLPPAWWRDADSAARAGALLGLAPLPGEDLPTFCGRLRAAIEQAKRVH